MNSQKFSAPPPPWPPPEKTLWGSGKPIFFFNIHLFNLIFGNYLAKQWHPSGPYLRALGRGHDAQLPSPFLLISRTRRQVHKNSVLFCLYCNQSRVSNREIIRIHTVCNVCEMRILNFFWLYMLRINNFKQLVQFFYQMKKN